MSFEESEIIIESSIIKEEYSINEQPLHYAKSNESPTPNSMESVQFVNKEVEEDKTTKKQFQCKNCSKEFFSKRRLQIHHKLSHNSDPITCDICKKILKNSGTMKRHLKTHDNERIRYKCDQCEITRMSKFGLQNHIKLVHKKATQNGPFQVTKLKKKLTCYKCGRKFLDKLKFDKHMLAHTEGKDIKCSKCRKTFKYKKQLDKHMDFHRNVKPFMCKICGIPFEKRGLLNKHAIRHVDSATICPYCKKTYKNRLSFKDHVRAIHKGLPIVIRRNGPLSCTVCREYFKNLDSLKDHVKIHNNKTPLECGHCGRLFKRKNNLKKHIVKVHLGIRKNQKRKPYVPREYKYACPHCDKKFYMKSHYSSHLSVHSDERPFKCKFCTKMVKTKEYLRKHERKHMLGNLCKSNEIVDPKQKHVDFPVNPASIKTEIEEDNENECLETEIEFTDYVKTEEDATYIVKREEFLE